MENLDEKNEVISGGDSANDDKTIGILSYIGLLWIVAYVLYGKKKSDYNVFHLRQGLGLFIVSIAIYIISSLPMIWRFSWILYFAWVAFAIMGIINAANGEKKELPFIGKFISDNLKSFK
ncbi:MAG: hypothetical protein B6I20_09830 [Bacteroidetes bacterium 4572_117]|nr:MAG: hypothetical protein B6I20_09830 [Bacteroidetes bacterium 4572_117]